MRKQDILVHTYIYIVQLCICIHYVCACILYYASWKNTHQQWQHEVHFESFFVAIDFYANALTCERESETTPSTARWWCEREERGCSIYCTYTAHTTYINCKYKKCKCAWHIKRWVGAIKQWRRVRQKGATRSRAECKDASTVPRLQVRPNCQKMQQTTEGEAEKPYAMQKWGLPCLPRTLRTIPAELFN